MEELVISPKFTLEDIQKIREYNERRRQLIGDEAFWAEVSASAKRMQAKIKEAGALKRQQMAAS